MKNTEFGPEDSLPNRNEIGMYRYTLYYYTPLALLFAETVKI